MKRMFKIFLFSALCGFAFMAYASEPEINCASPSSTHEENFCSNKTHEAADAKLNKRYQLLRDKLTPEEIKILKNIEQAWLSLRNQICNFETEPAKQGTGYNGFYSKCLAL